MSKISYKNKYFNSYLSIIFALFILGVIKSEYTNEKWYKSGTNISLYGAVAGFLTYNVSKFISSL